MPTEEQTRARFAANPEIKRCEIVLYENRLYGRVQCSMKATTVRAGRNLCGQHAAIFNKKEEARKKRPRRVILNIDDF